MIHQVTARMGIGIFVPKLAAFDHHLGLIKRAWYAWAIDGMRRELDDACEMGRELGEWRRQARHRR